jgi:hypothetical protein
LFNQPLEALAFVSLLAGSRKYNIRREQVSKYCLTVMDERAELPTVRAELQ